MISYIKGRLVETAENIIVVECNGIGYQMLVPLSVIDSMPPCGNDVKIYTHMHVREDLIQLFGFLTRDDLEVFKLLISVSGVGPKAALSILGTITADELRYAVMADDAKTIAKTPGIGAKTAGKLVIELKDKLKYRDINDVAGVSGQDVVKVSSNATDKNIISDAVEALAALGYSATDAMKAVRSVDTSAYTTVEELLKLSLKHMI
ncbi:MAG: Holliday junction branch migration protein RuvA [Lachnospiraceae bacterium]|nr:Holliday junction branch migration protein RuvA [Lachnospiraceae bacterium]